MGKNLWKHTRERTHTLEMEAEEETGSRSFSPYDTVCTVVFSVCPLTDTSHSRHSNKKKKEKGEGSTCQGKTASQLGKYDKRNKEKWISLG